MIAFLQLWRQFYYQELGENGFRSLLASARAMRGPLVLHMLNCVITSWRFYPVMTVHTGRVGSFIMLALVWGTLQLYMYIEVAEEHSKRRATKGVLKGGV
jgi:hypothetical protein